MTEASHNTIYVPLKNVQVKLNRNSVSINNENLDVELLQLLYQSYYNSKFSKLAQKPPKERLRVTYFDDFNLFRRESADGQPTGSQPPTTTSTTSTTDGRVTTASCNELFFSSHGERVFPTESNWRTSRAKLTYVASSDEHIGHITPVSSVIQPVPPQVTTINPENDGMQEISQTAHSSTPRKSVEEISTQTT